MNESDFEGSLVLEKLARIGCVAEFMDAADCDDFKKAKTLMNQADIDAATITVVLKKMADGDNEH